MKQQKTTIRTYVLAYLPSIIWAFVIFLFSSQNALPSLAQLGSDFFFKKTAHIFVYFVLYIFLSRAAGLTISDKNSKSLIWLPVLLCLVYATSDELHQSFVPGRFATLRDIGYDMLGVGIAFLKKYGYM